MAQQSVHPENSEQRKIGFKSYRDQTLGIGSYGAVYKAKCDDLLCAAKILHPTLFDPSAHHQVEPKRKHRLPIRRFEQECEFMGVIKHPNIVQCLGMKHDPDTNLPVLLMELMDDSLTRFLGNIPQQVPYHIQVNICHDISLALSFLHSNNIIHRDLSSNNVLLTGGIRAKVTDFGMAKLYESLNSEARTHLSYTVCPGADVYMPPEAIKEAPIYTAKIDCFSFGVLIVQILTQKFPNPGNRQKEVELNYPELPTGMLMINVQEIERRRTHIDEIDSKHPLLPTALDCLKDKGDERPSSHQICEQLEVLKQSSDYTDSIPELFSRISMWQHIQNLQQIKGQTIEQRKKMEASKIQLKEQDLRKTDQRRENINVLESNHPSGNSKPQQMQAEQKMSLENGPAATTVEQTKYQEQRKKESGMDSTTQISSTTHADNCASTQLEHGKDAVVQFSVCYDVAKSNLRVHLQCVSNLLMDHCKGNPAHVQCDPFVMLHLDPDRETALQSQVMKCTIDPIFNESFQFGQMSLEYVRLQTLVLQFYNHAQSNQVIGRAYAPLRNLELFETTMQVKVIHKDEVESILQGDLLISLSYNPKYYKLEGIVHKANLKKLPGTMADPYVKVVITYNNKRIFKWKSSVKCNTLSPVYNDGFSYEIPEDMRMVVDIENLMISFYVIDYDSTGAVTIGKNARSELGRKHWAEVLQSTAQRISFSHPIQMATATTSTSIA